MRFVHLMNLRFLKALAAWTCLALVAAIASRATLAQQPNGGISHGRDESAVDEALQGWWTASMKTHDQRIAWWRESEFGCFIHWGVYSTFGGEWNGKPFRGYAEHMMRSQKIPRAEYSEKVVSVFNPVKFDAEEWVRLIKAAGMKYVIITAKHHDGFAMYPSSVSRYNIRDATPFKRDPMRELAAAAKKHGLRFGFYYSHAFDWEHPDAPGNDWDYDNPAGDKGLHGGLLWYDKHPELLPKARKYVDEKAIPQIVELVKNYQPDILWFDTPSKIPLSENLRIMKAVREVAPNIVINGRLARGLGHSFGDYKNTGDRAAEMVPTEGDWETIPTTNESYGYHKHDHSHKPVSHFIQLMAKAAARGGNLLMNIGPMGDGQIDQKDQQILRGIGNWLAVNGESIYRTERSPLPVQPWGESTRQGTTLYLHVFDWPSDRRLVVGGLKSSVTRVYLLANPRQVLKAARLNDNDIVIDVPPKAADAADTVIAVQVKGEIKANPVRLLASTGQANVLRVFDGELHGTGLRFGDGKAPRAYVFEWKDAKEWVGWKVRVNQPSEFEVSLKYTTASPANRGSYTITIGDQLLKGTIDPTPNESQSATTSLGPVRLKAGEYEIAVRPDEIQGGELMRLFHISLTPARGPARNTASQRVPRVFLLDAKQLPETRNRIRAGDKSVSAAWAKLDVEAQKALTAGPFSVVTKDPTPPSGDKHDYMSQAPYFWPDPGKPGGLPYIRRDGERNPEINKITDHRSLDLMVEAVETLALAYYFRGDEAYATRAVKLLRAFFLDPGSRMNPHLQFAQAIPGVNTGRGIGLIETRGLTRVVDAVGLLAGSRGLTEADHRGLEDWFGKFLKWMLESKNGRDEAAAKNNHGTYYDLQVASFALFLGEKEFARDILQTARTKRIAAQIETDGRQPLELARTKAWSYSVGNLDGLMLLARLGESVGVDLWNYQSGDGRSIRRALDYLVPVALGEQKWTYQQLGEWPPQMLFPLMRRAAVRYRDPQFLTLLDRVPDIDSADRSRLLRVDPFAGRQAQR